MIVRVIQPIDWGTLAPFPIAVHSGVTAFIGVNGSGKSSALDALKAALGCARFGERRTTGGYLNDGRGVQRPASESFLLLCCDDTGEHPELADEHGRFTIAWWITPSRRVGKLIPGHVLLAPNGEDLASELVDFKEQHPRRTWLRPDEMQARVLDPLGATIGVQRLMEIPQGQTQKLLDGRPDRLLHDLLGFMGALDPLEALSLRRAQYTRAREEREGAQRAVLRAERDLARAQRDLIVDGRAGALAEQMEEVRARARGAARHALADAQIAEAASAELLDAARGALEDAHATLELAQRRGAALDQRALTAAREAIKALAESGIAAKLGVATLAADTEPGLLAVEAHRLCSVIVSDAKWEAAVNIAGAHPGVRFERSTGAVGRWQETLGVSDDICPTGSHFLVGSHALVPAVDLPLPFDGDGESGEDQARRGVWAAERACEEARRAIDAHAAAQRDAAHAIDALGDGHERKADADHLPGLLAEQARLADAARVAARAEQRRSTERELLERVETDLEESRELLSGQDNALEEATRALDEARTVYRGHVRRLVGRLDERFRDLCTAAGMRGELHVVDDPLAGEAGGRLHVMISETVDGPLRAYHGEADLSGGWRAKTAVLVLLAALSASSGERTLPLACLDEHSAALDEDRIEEIGRVFRRLSRDAGLQIVCAYPTKRSAEMSDWCDMQIAFLKPMPGTAYAPMPHAIEAAITSPDVT